MNNSEDVATQQVRSAFLGAEHSPVVPAAGSRYWWRLVKASALVAVGIAVHLWIDGADRVPVDAVSTVAAGVIASDGSLQAGAATAEEPLFSAPEPAQRIDAEPAVEPPHPVVRSGHRAVRATDAPVERADPQPARVYPLTRPAPPPAPPAVLRTGGLPDLPDAELPAVPSARRLAGWTGAAAIPSPVVVPQLKAADAREPLPVEPVPPASRAIRMVAATPEPREEESILQVLREYETAVGRNDPLAAKAVWPALDDRALARAFNDLQSQSLALEGCGVTVANSNAVARARCHGVATYLPKVGRRKPISTNREWTFHLAKAGGDWQIESAKIR